MSENDTKTEVKQSSAHPETFATEDLVARAPEYLGVQTFVAAGALHKANKNITLDEAKKLVKDFPKRPVEVEDRFKPAEERKA